MTATASLNISTNQLSITGDGLPSPVTYGTFPNVENENRVLAQNFSHAFLYRGGTFGTGKTFVSNTWSQTGTTITIQIAPQDLLKFQDDDNLSDINVNDLVYFNFSNTNVSRVYRYNGTVSISTPGTFWLSTDTTLTFNCSYNQTASGTYIYYDESQSNLLPLGAIGVSANGVILFNSSAGLERNPPQGFNYIAAGDSAYISFGEDLCGGNPDDSGQYHYDDGNFISCWNQINSIRTYNDYYGSSQYNNDYLRHPDGHSKVLGISFDGFPIYGPYSYDEPWNNRSEVRTMVSSYRLKTIIPVGRPTYQSIPNGSFIQDWEYLVNLGDLDSHNGRFCRTPEYPNGTYAYFITVDPEDDDVPKFPFIIGLSTRETIQAPLNNGANPIDPDEPPVEPPVSGPSTIVITLQPQNVTTNSGEIATFSITASIEPENRNKSYQWQRSTDNGFSWSNINGATSATYSLTTISYMTGYRFRCQVRGPVGITPQATNSPLISNAAVLTVTGTGQGSGTTFDDTNTTLDTTIVTFDAT
jgi:hypothetical protein